MKTLEIDNKMVGFGQGIFEQSYRGKMGLLNKIYLNKDGRGKGLVTKIAHHLMQEMKKQNIDFFEWKCYNSNQGFVKLAKKLGLKPFSMRFRKNIKQAS